MGDVLIRVLPSGQAVMLYDERLDLAELGRADIRRAGHVEPVGHAQWSADLSPIGGPSLGPFDRRSEAVAAEVEYIRNTYL